MRTTVRPWLLCGFTCLCIAAYLGLYATADYDLLSIKAAKEGIPVIPAAVVIGAVMGALILSPDPRHRIGWLLSVGQAGTALGLAASAYGYRVLIEHELGPPAAGHVAAWVSHLLGAAYALPFTSALFLLVPDGRLLSRRWRPVLAALFGSYLLYVCVLPFAVPPLRAPVDTIGYKFALPAVVVFSISSLLLIAGSLGAALALLLRLRRSAGAQRRQMRWIMASAALLAGGQMALVVIQATVVPEPWWAPVPLYLGYASVPVCTGIAVLRYRLYDIDVIISRAFVLAVLATFVTVGYVAVVVLIGTGPGTGAGGHFWPSLVALVLVALAFQPVRLRVMRTADRLVYGPRAVPYEALADFGRRLGHSAAPAELLPSLAEAVARSVGAGYSRVSLDVPGASGLSVTWPGQGQDRVPDLEVDVHDRGERLGRIAVAMPPGRGLRSAERRLLADFGAQAGLAFRNLRLDAELRARVEQSERQSEELAASRRRLLAARDDERRRTSATIEREVLSHLRPMPAAVESLEVGEPARAEETLDRLEAATGAALDALREVTQGLFPVTLARRGLIPALRSHLARAGRSEILAAPADLDGRRFDERTEAAAYFCCVAATRDADLDRLALRVEGELLVVEATGRPRDPEHWAEERTAIVDRVEAAGGHVTDRLPEDGRLMVRAALPTAVDTSTPPGGQSPET